MNSFFPIDGDLLAAAAQAEADCAGAFQRIAETEEHNAQKVLRAFIDNRVSESLFGGSTGYGYDDRGRETLDRVFAEIFGTEDALARHNFMSGTHAISTALFGVLRPGDTMVSLSGAPYDTLHDVIHGRGVGSLEEFGVIYKELPLLPDGSVDLEGIPEAVKGAKMAYLQRSRGYSLRPSLSIDEIRKIFSIVKEANPRAVRVVDNCYGEFVCKEEPTQCGADLAVGSLIKNPGGGIADTGGYIAGTHEYVELCANRLSAPGVGREIGCTLGELRPMYLGLFFAPTVTAAAVKTAVFASRFFELLGYHATPDYREPRTDIIETIELGGKEALCAFCRGIQSGSPIDAFVTPEPWAMPGYDDPVIMAAGAFHLGASIELSADAPLREPYAVWMQGGLTYPTAKAGVLLAAQSMRDAGVLRNG
ncbi:MAG TPA: methionine gamma-lyase family protein [Oscillospiraceae bacterium]|nr:methionine gamma-lyase family protein [Oscillospiraceae bacterium]HNW03790.1 methionine gamma-lyase family protein [Oscillospiraceae bacterium]HPV99891.1 methionine gamma-lyase family protein [Oscillospiraceae bacterium]